MRTKELIRSITKRTGIPHGDVMAVLDAMGQIALEQVRGLESLHIPRIGKLYCRAKHGGGWKIDIAFKEKLANAVDNED